MSDNNNILRAGGSRSRVQVELPPDLRAVYANLALILHTTNEFFVDFAQLLPGIAKTQVHTRIVMTPTHAKLLYRALGENIERYEASHGEVDVPPTLADQLFRTAKPPSDPNTETS
jgi:hypothetical protein